MAAWPTRGIDGARGRAARRLAPRIAARAAEYDRAGDVPGRRLRRPARGRPVRPDGAAAAGRRWARASPTTPRVAFELARGNGATALVFNMHASVTGALGAVPDELAEALGVPDEALAARDRLLAGGRRGRLVRGGDERARRRLAAVPAGDRATSRSTAASTSRARRRSCSGAGHADAYLVAARSARRPVGGVAVPGAGRRDGPDRGADLGLDGHAGHRVARPAPRRRRARRPRCSAAWRGWRCWWPS